MWPLTQTCARGQADRELGAGPGISQRVVVLPIEIVRARREFVDVFLPGGDGIGPIQAAQAIDLVPQAARPARPAGDPETPSPPSLSRRRR